MNCNYIRLLETCWRLITKNSEVKLFPSVALFCLILAPSAALTAAPIYIPPTTHRADVNLDEGWRFVRADTAGAQEPGFADAKWESINLPHTWNNLDGQDGGTNYYRGPGWYRKHFKVDNAYAGRRLFLKFDGAFSVTEVWVNGNRLGEHRGGFAAFVFDATPFLKVGGDNVLAVKVSNAFDPDVPPLSADFTFFGGLYRDVHLLA